MIPKKLKQVGYLHQSKVKREAEGRRNTPYTAPICNRLINMTFFHTMILAGLGPSFSLYVWSKTSSLGASGTTLPLLDLCCCCCCGCFFSSASVIVAVGSLVMHWSRGGHKPGHLGCLSAPKNTLRTVNVNHCEGGGGGGRRGWRGGWYNSVYARLTGEAESCNDDAHFSSWCTVCADVYTCGINKRNAKEKKRLT